MAIKKNPDWHVWVADVLHWARQAPQIYVLIVVTGIATLFSIRGSPPQKAYQPPAPQYVPQQQYVPLPPPPAAAAQFPRKIPLPSALEASPLKDNCPIDYIYIDSRHTCTPVISGRWYVLARGNTIRLSQLFATRVTYGRIQVVSNDSDTRIIEPIPDSFPPTRVNGGTIIALETLTRVGFQFPLR